MEPDFDKHPFGSPTFEYQRKKGYEHADEIFQTKDVTNHDLLVAMLLTGESLFHQLQAIRVALEHRGTP